MGSVADFVEDTVSDVVDTVGDVADSVVHMAEDAVEDVGNTVEGVVEGALQDPIGTMATVAAVATQQYYLLPAISAGKVVANGGDLDDALKAAAITYAAGEIGGMAGDQVSTAANYGTELGSAQTAALAAQDAGMGMGTLGGKLAGTVAGAGTSAALSGRDLDQSIMGALAGFGMNLGMNAAGQIVNEVGDVIADSYDEFLADMNQTADQPGDYPLNAEELAAADIELGGLPSINEGDQPGDYDTTPEEMAASEQELADMDVAQEYGDQEGDFPTTPEDLALADEELAQLPAAEEYADQPGDYDTTPEEVAASEEILAGMPNASSDLNLSGVADYFKNQFLNAGLKNLIGGTGGSGYVGRSGASGGAGANATTAGMGSDPFLEVTDPFASTSGSTQDTGDINLYGENQNNVVAPQSVLRGLGASGAYVNPNAQTYYQTPTDAQKAREAAAYKNTSGWQGAGEDQFGMSTTNDPYGLYSNTDPSGYAEGGLAGLGGEEHNPQFFSEGGAQHYVRGEGDGTSDSVAAMLARGEFVFPADVVSSLGNGDNEAGAEVLDNFMRTIREHKRSTPSDELPPDSKGPLSYLKEAYKKAGK